MAPVYNTPEGRALIERILEDHEPPIHPHVYQTEGVAIALDGESLLATMATGSGKTGFFAFTMIVMQAIARDPSLALHDGPTFAKNPAMLIVLPTKALQYDMQAGLDRLGLNAVVINGDTVLAAAEGNQNLWTECHKKHSMILISPEELQTASFRELLATKEFSARVCRLGIDEVHLIYTWGREFRQTFAQLGHIRTRLPSLNGGFIPVIATSATIREGLPKTMICSTLGLRDGDYHLLRRSNLRQDIRIIVREMISPIGGASFPELEWTLDSTDNTVIFCKTIGLGFRVAAYLWRKGIAKGMDQMPSRIRLFNSLNSQSYNEETLGFLNDNKQSSITVATDVLSVGWDSPFTKNVITVGELGDIDEFVQKIGRAGRNKTKVQQPCAFLYHSKGPGNYDGRQHRQLPTRSMQTCQFERAI
ncbi:hypothetical protein EST38_g10860 [Candolleomyces aberdarensis]|uniref:DNA 3'-5' helicase n=1 Tax=Candolleomyces aberdarensis TaxID=2316362 RepID=A0A4Q2D961_9AGAR|nr:hypothetical protein EST38_g10860 [Candolleomyces aberdarensis]